MVFYVVLLFVCLLFHHVSSIKLFMELFLSFAYGPSVRYICQGKKKKRKKRWKIVFCFVFTCWWCWMDWRLVRIFIQHTVYTCTNGHRVTNESLTRRKEDKIRIRFIYQKRGTKSLCSRSSSGGWWRGRMRVWPQAADRRLKKLNERTPKPADRQTDRHTAIKMERKSARPVVLLTKNKTKQKKTSLSSSSSSCDDCATQKEHIHIVTQILYNPRRLPHTVQF